MIEKPTLNKYIYIIFFLAFSGYYAILILVVNYLSSSLSRFFTIPLRIVILMLLFFIYKKSYTRNLSDAGKFFIVFSIFYLIRIGVETIKLADPYMSTWNFLFYFLGFAAIPFVLLQKTKLNDYAYTKIVDAILLSSFILSFLTYFFYGSLLGKVARISNEVSHDENYISPLALSYCSTLAIGVGCSYLLTNKVSKKKLIFIIGVLVSCLVPFFLGASRGAILAMIIPFLLYFIYSAGVKNKFKIIFMSVIVIIFTSYVTGFFGTGVFDRFMSIGSGIEKGSSSSIRLEIWKSGLDQFLNNPFFGNSLESEMVNHYPHNIIIEVLLSTGIMGFIPFIMFLFLTFKKCILIIRVNPKYFWIVCVFMQAFIQNMFSGAIWSASWLVIGAALVLGLKFKNI